MESITRIIKGCIDGEHKYQKIIYDHYRGYALKIAFRYVYRYEKAVDIVNDAFVKLFRYFEKFTMHDGDDNEKIMMGLLKRILINTAIDELRKGNMLPEIGGIPDYVWDMPDKSQNADELLLYKDLIVMIKELPPSYRSVFNLYVIDGYTHIEIAEMLHISMGTSKSSLSRARALLKDKIKKIETDQLCRI